MPNPVIALQANRGFASVMAQAKVALVKHATQAFGGLNTDNLIILGFSIKGNRVAVEAGSATHMWPTNVYKTGEIQAQFRFFPDGVNGIMIEGQPVYVDQTAIGLYPASSK